MISRRELNPHGYILTREQKENFERLYELMNRVRVAYGKPMIVTSGVRSEQDQLRINPRHPNSMHTRAAACDIRDNDRAFWNWCMANLEFLAELGLYLEDKRYTPTWTHIQCLPPKSGNRIFIP